MYSDSDFSGGSYRRGSRPSSSYHNYKQEERLDNKLESYFGYKCSCNFEPTANDLGLLSKSPCFPLKHRNGQDMYIQIIVVVVVVLLLLLLLLFLCHLSISDKFFNLTLLYSTQLHNI